METHLGTLIPLPPGSKAEQFVGCPSCGKTDGYIVVGGDHWFYCIEHRCTSSGNWRLIERVLLQVKHDDAWNEEWLDAIADHLRMNPEIVGGDWRHQLESWLRTRAKDFTDHADALQKYYEEAQSTRN